MQPDARGIRRVEAAQRDERAARRHLGVAPVGVAEAEERGEVPGLAPQDAAAPALDEARGLVDDGGGDLARQLDDQAGHLAALAHLDRAVDRRRGARRATRGRSTRDARPGPRPACAPAAASRLGLEERPAGGAHGQGAVVGLAEPREELGQVVRAVAAALRVEEREQRLVHPPGVRVAIGGRPWPSPS